MIFVGVSKTERAIEMGEVFIYHVGLVMAGFMFQHWPKAPYIFGETDSQARGMFINRFMVGIPLLVEFFIQIVIINFYI